MPFWQKTAVAPLFLTISTIRFNIASSSFRKAWSWVGSVISIFASISVFLTSSAASISAIFASFTSLGIPGLLCGLTERGGNHGGVDVLVDQVFRPLEQLPGQDDGRRRAVAGFLVLGLRDLDEHLRRGVFDINLL